MADQELYCKNCRITNPHTFVGGVSGRLFICAACGGETQGSGVKSVVAAIQERKAKAMASIGETKAYDRRQSTKRPTAYVKLSEHQVRNAAHLYHIGRLK